MLPLYVVHANSLFSLSHVRYKCLECNGLRGPLNSKTTFSSLLLSFTEIEKSIPSPLKGVFIAEGRLKVRCI